jgi:hypothetical protein
MHLSHLETPGYALQVNVQGERKHNIWLAGHSFVKNGGLHQFFLMLVYLWTAVISVSFFELRQNRRHLHIIHR